MSTDKQTVVSEVEIEKVKTSGVWQSISEQKWRQKKPSEQSDSARTQF